MKITITAQTEEDITTAIYDLIAQGWQSDGDIIVTENGYLQSMVKTSLQKTI